VFGHSGEDAENVIYANWLTMTRAGLLALEFFSPETNSWRQVSSLFISHHHQVFSQLEVFTFFCHSFEFTSRNIHQCCIKMIVSYDFMSPYI